MPYDSLLLTAGLDSIADIASCGLFLGDVALRHHPMNDVINFYHALSRSTTVIRIMSAL